MTDLDIDGLLEVARAATQDFGPERHIGWAHDAWKEAHSAFQEAFAPDVAVAVLLRLKASEAEKERLNAEIQRRIEVSETAWGDKADQWSDAIDAAHPMKTRDHDTFAVAMEMVGHRHGKYELVGLVNWLLTRAPNMKADSHE